MWLIKNFLKRKKCMCQNENGNGKISPPILSGSSGVDRSEVEMVVSGCLRIMEKQRQHLAENFRDAVAQLGSQVVQLGTAQKQMGYSIDAAARQLATIGSQNQVLEAVLRENFTATEAYYQEHIVEPMITILVAVIDLIDDARSSWLQNAILVDGQMNELLDGIRTQLIQFFQVYGIEMIHHNPGVRFDRQVMRPAKTVQISSAELDLCIAKSLQAGFRSVRSGRLLRVESVVLYKCKENSL